MSFQLHKQEKAFSTLLARTAGLITAYLMITVFILYTSSLLLLCVLFSLHYYSNTLFVVCQYFVYCLFVVCVCYIVFTRVLCQLLRMYVVLLHVSHVRLLGKALVLVLWSLPFTASILRFFYSFIPGFVFSVYLFFVILPNFANGIVILF